jgi:hypothetical protein
LSKSKKWPPQPETQVALSYLAFPQKQCCEAQASVMTIAHDQVVRWTALIAGVGYGIVHQTTLQTKYDAEKVRP